MNIVFLGTADFSATILRGLLVSNHNVVCVVSQCDKVSAKGKLLPTAVKIIANESGIPCHQYENISSQAEVELANYNADVFVTAAYGQMLKQNILEIPRLGIINVHGSLLPKYRGASPIQQAILSGELITGISIMRTELGMDSGDVIYTETINIGEDETAGQLFDRMSELGVVALIKALDMLDTNTAQFTKQNESDATFCRKITKENGVIDYNTTFFALNCKVRAYSPWPSAFTFVNGLRLKVHKVTKYSDTVNSPIGSVVFADNKNGLVVQLQDSQARLEMIQLEGKRAMQDKELLLGYRINVEQVL